MKTFYFAAILAVFLFFCANGIQAQTALSPIIQSGLIEQLQSNQQPKINQPFDENKIQLTPGFEKLQNQEILKAGKTNQLKSATEDGQKLDSVITETWDTITSQWVVSGKEKNAYDENGNRTSFLNFSWDKANRQWIESSYKTLYIFDSKGNMTESMFHIYCNERYCYECNHQTTYDSKGNITLVIWYTRLNSTEQWKGWPQTKSEYEYNSNGEITLCIKYQWNNSTNQWDASFKTENIRDGNIMYLNNYEWDSKTNLWVVFNQKQKFEYTYNESENQTLRLTYFWDVTSNQWVVHEKTENTYDTNGNITSDGSFLWDKTKTQWVKYLNGQSFGKHEWAYDSNDNMILNLFYEWKHDVNQLIPSWKHEYAYDASGNITSLIDSYWVDSTKQWTVSNKIKNDYAYDSNGNKAMEINYTWDKTANKFVYDRRTTSYYSDKSASSIPNITTPHLTVYPNPAKDFVAFNLPYNNESIAVELYDIQGKKVVEQKLIETKQIAVSQLPKGLYMYRLTDGEKVYLGKLVVK